MVMNLVESSELGIDDDLIEYGLDSMGVMKLSIEIQKKYGVNIAFTTIFEDARLSKIVDDVEEGLKLKSIEFGVIRESYLDVHGFPRTERCFLDS
jgi:aryl carrier-like protein